MDWDVAIKRNSEVLRRSLGPFSPCWGLWAKQRFRGFPGPPTGPCCGCCVPPNPPCAGSLSLRRGALWLKPASPVPCGREASSKEGRNFKSLLPALRSANPHRAAAPENPADLPAHPHVQRRQRMVTMWPPPRPAAKPAPPAHPLMAWSARRGLSAGSRRSSPPLLICRARPSASPAGGCGRKRRQTPASNPRSGRAVRRATGGGRFTKSMNCSASAIGWPVTLGCPTRVEAEIIRIRINLITFIRLKLCPISHARAREKVRRSRG